MNLPIKFENKRHEALISLWWTSQLLTKQFRALFKKFNLTELQFNVLMVIKYNSELLTQKELGDKIMVEKSNMTVIVDAMEQKGLIKRIATEGDRRSYNLILTQKGKSILSEVEKQYYQQIHDDLASVSDRQIISLDNILTKIRKNIK